MRHRNEALSTLEFVDHVSRTLKRLGGREFSGSRIRQLLHVLIHMVYIFLPRPSHFSLPTLSFITFSPIEAYNLAGNCTPVPPT